MKEDDDRAVKAIGIEGLSKHVFEKYGEVEGKWCGFVDRDDVEEVWASLCNALYDDLLEERLLVAPSNPSTTQHVLCVITSNYTDRPLQDRLIKTIRSTGITSPLHLKPSLATALNLYPGIAPWGHRATSLFYVAENSHHILTAGERSKRDGVRRKFSVLSDAL
eukprot:TRINITY_DN23706_c1_g2_i1.p1 TRINITY_DN23706_c1_g2~~TRINITY_DN23706_c1_g2_i1.p1  ORF type:complete len:185 (+),score=33.79 TRINITY_DN23706_c1_g2_i1:65-556(+)